MPGSILHILCYTDTITYTRSRLDTDLASGRQRSAHLCVFALRMLRVNIVNVRRLVTSQESSGTDQQQTGDCSNQDSVQSCVAAIKSLQSEVDALLRDDMLKDTPIHFECCNVIIDGNVFFYGTGAHRVLALYDLLTRHIQPREVGAEQSQLQTGAADVLKSSPRSKHRGAQGHAGERLLAHMLLQSIAKHNSGALALTPDALAGEGEASREEWRTHCAAYRQLVKLLITALVPLQQEQQECCSKGADSRQEKHTESAPEAAGGSIGKGGESNVRANDGAQQAGDSEDAGKDTLPATLICDVALKLLNAIIHRVQSNATSTTANGVLAECLLPIYVHVYAVACDYMEGSNRQHDQGITPALQDRAGTRQDAASELSKEPCAGNSRASQSDASACVLSSPLLSRIMPWVSTTSFFFLNDVRFAQITLHMSERASKCLAKLRAAETDPVRHNDDCSYAHNNENEHVSTRKQHERSSQLSIAHTDTDTRHASDVRQAVSEVDACGAVEEQSVVVESAHPYDDSEREVYHVKVPGAAYLIIQFDLRSCLANGDSLQVGG
jgi:hypothetical protein